MSKGTYSQIFTCLLLFSGKPAEPPAQDEDRPEPADSPAESSGLQGILDAR